MNIKVIEFLESERRTYAMSDIEAKKVEGNIKDIIALLERGEKYEAMWEELEKSTVYNKDGNYKHSWSEELIGIMHKLKREIPKPIKKTITIEIEGEDFIALQLATIIMKKALKDWNFRKDINFEVKEGDYENEIKMGQRKKEKI